MRGSRITFSFRAKHRALIRTAVVDAELADAMRELKSLEGGRVLFRYRNGTGLCNLTGKRLNDYIHENMGEEFTAKDFRTWGGTLRAAIALAEQGVAETEAERKGVIASVMRGVGERLGNTPAVARASYVSLPLSASISKAGQLMTLGHAICVSWAHAMLLSTPKSRRCLHHFVRIEFAEFEEPRSMVATE